MHLLDSNSDSAASWGIENLLLAGFYSKKVEKELNKKTDYTNGHIWEHKLFLSVVVSIAYDVLHLPVP